MFTNGNDVVFLEGMLQQITVTLTNPYSSKEYDVDDELFVNTGVYDGLGGTDTLIGTNNGDFLSIETVDNSVMMQVVTNIERFIAGDGGDVINLASNTATIGDVIITGGRGDDILWANIGNDTIAGFDGNDILDGGPGNDTLRGENDDDQIFGGAGDDFIDGGSGNDILYGGTDLGLMELDKDFVDNITFPDLQSSVNIKNLIPPGTPALGINSENLSVEYEASATLTFREGYAGYNNTLGMYSISEDGTIQMAEILWGNVKTAGFNNDYTIDLPVGENGGDFGFFIIANGNSVNNGYQNLDITGENVIEFIYDYGGANQRAATINDDGNNVSVVYNDGSTVQVLQGHHYHTTARGEDNSINWDGETHAVSGLVDLSNQDVLRIGFEDLPNLGDADYEDVMFDLDIDRIHIDASEQGNDTIIGGAGDDIIYGEAGNDLLYIGQDFDQVYGGSGADTFFYLAADSLTDKIYDFSADEGDSLNISVILSGYDPLTDAINDFVRLNDTGNDTELLINADGDAGGDFTAVAIFEGGLDETLETLITNGNVIVQIKINLSMTYMAQFIFS